MCSYKYTNFQNFVAIGSTPPHYGTQESGTDRQPYIGLKLSEIYGDERIELHKYATNFESVIFVQSTLLLDGGKYKSLCT